MRASPGNDRDSHRHAYDETGVVVEGNLAFQAGEERHRAQTGDIVIVPRGAGNIPAGPRRIPAGPRRIPAGPRRTRSPHADLERGGEHPGWIPTTTFPAADSDEVPGT
jgi:Cupin domain